MYMLVFCTIFLLLSFRYNYSYRQIGFLYGFRYKNIPSTNYFSVPDWLQEGSTTGEEDFIPTIKVRFINTVSGKDVVVEDVPIGSNLLAVGDSAGVKLPRACRTGLCGSCTCEVKDPLAIATSTNPRDGFATIRACSTKCFVPNGLDEMVVDVYRMQRKPKKAAIIGRDSTAISVEDLNASVILLGFILTFSFAILTHYSH